MADVHLTQASDIELSERTQGSGFPWVDGNHRVAHTDHPVCAKGPLETLEKGNTSKDAAFLVPSLEYLSEFDIARWALGTNSTEPGPGQRASPFLRVTGWVTWPFGVCCLAQDSSSGSIILFGSGTFLNGTCRLG